jgi:hypothetical protein
MQRARDRDQRFEAGNCCIALEKCFGMERLRWLEDSTPFK